MDSQQFVSSVNDDRSGVVHKMSCVKFKPPPKHSLMVKVLCILKKIGLLHERRVVVEGVEFIEMNNLTLSNLALLWFGSMNDRTYFTLLISAQCCSNCVGLLARYYLAGILYG